MNRRCAIGVAAGLATACADERGPLHRDEVAELSRTPGTAVGIAFSGIYDLRAMPEECGCESNLIVDELSLCALAGGIDTPFPLDFEADAVQADGFFVVDASRAENATLSGAIDEDGAFRIGMVSDFTTIVTEGYQVMRLEGEIEIDDDRHLVTGELDYALRVEGRIPDDELGVDTDCTERFTFEGFRRFVPG